MSCLLIDDLDRDLCDLLLPLRAVGHVRGELLAQAVVVDDPRHDSFEPLHLPRKVSGGFQLRNLHGMNMAIAILPNRKRLAII